MSRCSSTLLALAGALLVGAVAPAGSVDDRLERYLEQRGLDDLLALQMRERVRAADARDRPALADRLSRIYARLIEDAQIPEARARWRDGANELILLGGENASMDIRLRIRAAEYVAGERLAERWRIAGADDAQKEEAISVLRIVAEDLARIGAEADRSVLRLQREEESAPADERALLAGPLSDARQTRSLAFYLAGWSNAYMAYLQSAPARAEEAMRNFGWLLGANPGQPAAIPRLPVGLLRYDHVARAAIGVAWCQAMLGRERECRQWLDAVDSAEEVAPEALAVLPLWKIVSLAALNDWPGVQRIVHDAGDLSDPMARLVASLAFEAAAQRDSPDARILGLRDSAVAALVASGDLAQVIALGRRYGLTALGDDGFAARCVRGLTLFHEARADESAGSRTLLEAADALAHALDAPDREQFGAAAGEASSARAQALVLAARRERGRRAGELLAQASGEFERAASLLTDPGRVADALYWAVRALDDAAAAGAGIDDENRARLAGLLIDGRPDDERAGLLLVEELGGREDLDDAMIARLRRIQPASRAFDPARRLVSRALYARFLAAEMRTRDWAALRYADAAEEILADDARAALAGDDDAARRALTRARRILAALLEVTAPDARRARRALDLARRMADFAGASAPNVALELTYREAQVALAEDRLADAETSLAELLGAGAPGAQFADSLRASILRRAVLAWQSAKREGAPAQVVTARARVAVAVGAERLASASTPESDALALQATLAQAAADIWGETGDEAMLERALAWLTEVHNAGVINLESTALLADLAERAGQTLLARDAWRDLAAALAPPDVRWFEARFHFMRIVGATDPSTARTLLDQHAVLYPDFGPAPWGERIRALHDSQGAPARGAGS